MIKMLECKTEEQRKVFNTLHIKLMLGSIKSVEQIEDDVEALNTLLMYKAKETKSNRKPEWSES